MPKYESRGEATVKISLDVLKKNSRKKIMFVESVKDEFGNFRYLLNILLIFFIFMYFLALPKYFWGSHRTNQIKMLKFIQLTTIFVYLT